MNKPTKNRAKPGKSPQENGDPKPVTADKQTAWRWKAGVVVLSPLAYFWSKWLFENPTTAPIAAAIIAVALVLWLGIWLGRLRLMEG